jgi:hypothetical protein
MRFAQGATLPVTSEYMPILAARMAQHAGEFDTARMLWVTTYESTKEARIRQNAVEHLLALQVDEEVTQLEQVVENTRPELDGCPPAWAIWSARGLFMGRLPIRRNTVQADAGWPHRSAGIRRRFPSSPRAFRRGSSAATAARETQPESK